MVRHTKTSELAASMIGTRVQVNFKNGDQISGVLREFGAGGSMTMTANGEVVSRELEISAAIGPVHVVLDGTEDLMVDAP